MAKRTAARTLEALERRAAAEERRAAAEERIAAALERLTEGLLTPGPEEEPEPECPHPEAARLMIGINGPSWKCQQCGHIEWIKP